MNNTHNWINRSVMALAVASAAGSSVRAESGGESEFVIEEIVVTAQKREQLLQEVPIAVSAFSGEELVDAGIIDVAGLKTVSPSLMITSSTSESSGTSLRIRGVGTAGSNTGLEGSVGVFVDGVYLSRSGIAMNNLVDIERVEVLRGPQGTLFGKNTSSGALAIHTKQPEFDFGAMLDLSYGSNDEQQFKGSVTGALIEDKLAGRIAFGSHTRDGLISDVNTGEEYNDRDRWTVRGQLLFTPSDDVDIRVIADYGEKDESCCASPYSEYGVRQTGILALGGTTASLDPFDRKVAVDGTYDNSTEEYGFSAELKWSLGEMVFTSISSIRNYEYALAADVDRSDIDIANTTRFSEVETITQELRLQGVSGMLDWMVGAYFFAEDIVEQSSTLYGSQTGDFFATFVGNPATQETIRNSYVEGGGALSDDFYQEARGRAIFTHNNIALADDLSLTIGLRYNFEEKEGAGVFVSQSTPLCDNPGGLRALGILCPRPDYESDQDDDEVTGTVKLSYAFSEDTLVYGGYSRGFKAGGISLNRNAGLSEFEFLPEIVDSWEIGTKSSLLNRRLRFNTAIYYAEYEDFQINTFDGITTIVSNAAGVRSRGLELDVVAMLVPGLVVSGGYAYNDSEYTGDTIAPGLAGEQLNNAPKSTVTLRLAYKRTLGDSGLRGFASLNGRYRSGTNTGTNLNPAKYQSDVTVANARIGIGDDDMGWEVALWGRNIFDEDYHIVVIDTPAQAGSFSSFAGEPASYGISAKFNF